MANILKTSDEWVKLWEAKTGGRILDPDGWRHDLATIDYYNDKITLDDFKNRLMRCTIKITEIQFNEEDIT